MFRFISDPGHGWLEVPRSLLVELEIVEDITPYSYQNKGLVYLEEDCDASKFFAAYNASRGYPPAYVEEHQDPTPIRNYQPFQA